jgi:hypothetical protein
MHSPVKRHFLSVIGTALILVYVSRQFTFVPASVRVERQMAISPIVILCFPAAFASKIQPL